MVLQRIHNIFKEFFSGLDQRLKTMFVAIGLNNWAVNLPSQYNQLYARSLGADMVELGSLNGIGSLVNSLLSPLMGWFTDKYGFKKVILFGFFLSASVSIIYASATTWWFLIPAIIFSQISLYLIMPLTDMLLIGNSKPEKRAFVMGFTRTIWSLPAMLAPLSAAVIVDHFGGINIDGIKPLYFIELSITLFIILFIIVKLEPFQTKIKSKKTTNLSKTNFFSDYKELFKGERWLKHWIVIWGLRECVLSLSFPFINIWLVEIKGANEQILGLVGTFAVLTSFILYLPVSYLCERFGGKKIYILLRIFTFFGTAILILASNYEHLILAGILGGITGGGINGVSQFPFLIMYWEAVPAEKRGRWHGFTNLLNIFKLPLSLLGGFIWQSGMPIIVFIIPMLTEIFLMMPLLLIVPDDLSLQQKKMMT